MIAGVRRIALALVVALVSGCAGRDCCPAPAGCGTMAPRVLECNPAERIPVRPDVTAIAAQDVAPRSDDAAKFCGLAEREAQCLAAKNATSANLLVHEAEAAASQPTGLCGHKNDSALTSEVLRQEAIGKRNQAASEALQVFLKLLEAEGGSDNLARRGQELNLVLADIGRLQERGILAPVSKPETEGQRLLLWGQQVELAANVQTLNFQLKSLLGVETIGDARIWPQASLTVIADVPDRQQAVEVALANRADLAAVRLVAYSDSAESESAAQAVLQLAGGGLGATPPSACLVMLVHHAAADEQRAARSQQIAELLADRQRAARDETLQAVMILDARIKQIAITRRRLEVAQAHLQAAEQQQQLTSGAPLGVRKARLELLAVEQDLLHDVIAWKLAVVKLKEAQGLLAVECGYGAGSAPCCP